MSTMTPEPSIGPCQPWCEPQDVIDCCPDIATSDTALIESAALAASQILFPMSGRQFAGVCEQTVRPCAAGCGCWAAWMFPGLSPGAPQFPVGSWGWWGPGSGGWGWGSSGCGCSCLSQALLPGYPVVEITEVKIDGVVLAADEYRLDSWRWLTRMADPVTNEPQFWPGCQRLDLPDTEVGTWSASYTYGMLPPLIGVKAAAQLACEILKACGGGECELPTGTIQVTRAGLTVLKEPFLIWGRRKDGNWATGLPLVDLFLSAVNPSGLKRRPVAWSPGPPTYARRIGS